MIPITQKLEGPVKKKRATFTITYDRNRAELVPRNLLIFLRNHYHPDGILDVKPWWKIW